ncbi:hypothetical protein M513_06640 [Trichuris suis]|uniref:Uncharacterized protein n=1 Tax=Trichuris suis TaxID=68888 RepID=A0A085M5E7_9BILA|nr:hypothetical protein M513_06640 [Trichuris suis]
MGAQSAPVFIADIAEKYGGPVYSNDPPIMQILPPPDIFDVSRIKSSDIHVLQELDGNKAASSSYIVIIEWSNREKGRDKREDGVLLLWVGGTVVNYSRLFAGKYVTQCMLFKVKELMVVKCLGVTGPHVVIIDTSN